MFRLVVPLLLTFSASPASAALVLTFTGTPGSVGMTVAGAGSITATGSPSGPSNSSFLQVPDALGEWAPARNNIGDYLAPSWTAFGSEGRELVLTGDLRLVGSGSSTFSYPIVRLRLDDDVSAGGDDLDLRFASVRSYPDFPSGLTVFLEGESAFTLGDGNTFDDLVPGRYSLSGFGVAGEERVDFVILPESATGALVMSALLAWSLRRCRAWQNHEETES